ncbi:MAG: D-glycero-beta-D-manno-heptose 1-phosphate adenylyltransferase [Cytophagales bacterium]|jgi:D-beta-D-heptose 7-phosphate kinase/D-beta-D-heptose 1-phosphate adenosyltransferase|nr:D-glycero-beta-D-manno-heptose 1-phosphate adenylyltransferase [Cytophagales bacterium]MCA6372947.1 D-glycero-beta-D-manno-heptose 1-phosphate adenylyltransferase [Cytophagales bacterium]MCA6376233.1 D-glycero-beta-D-manno-heptose 1-phosphate adenylyltransferase [Cytophagales bacterium]MCA6383299.1 D-glycero-beta-D-manno-heptose 1-phosphate adenylyltransferase [Cytophagales bacterium]
MLDVFEYGDIEKISPEAPVPVIRINKKKEMLGGAGNVLRNLNSLRCNVSFTALIGNDSNGEKIDSLLRTFSHLDYELHACEQPTIVKTRFISNNQQVLRADIEERFKCSSEVENKMLDFVRQRLPKLDLVVISDYNKGTITTPFCRQLIEMCRAHSVPVFVDPKGKNYQKYAQATLIKPNRKELSDCFDSEEIEGKEAFYAAKLREDTEVTYVLVTLGKDGMMLHDKNNCEMIDSITRQVFDVSGAGDTVMATLAAGYSAGLTIIEAAKLANIAAGIVVSKPETAIVTPEELSNEMYVTSKIQSPVSIRELIEYWQRNNFVIGFTNGCFDLLHPGHVATLKFCKQKCDRLIIGLNSDQSVRQLKGNKRPVNHELHRALVLSEFASVDAIVIFEEDTPEELIQIIRPDLLVKGGDYIEDDVAGAAFIKSYGGKVLICPYVDGFSSTRIVDRIENVAYAR